MPDEVNLEIYAKSNAVQSELDERLKELFENTALQAELDANMEALFRGLAPAYFQDNIMTIVFGDDTPVASAPAAPKTRKKPATAKSRKRAAKPTSLFVNIDVENESMRASPRRNPSRREKKPTEKKENIQSSTRRNPSRRAKLSVVNESMKPKGKPKGKPTRGTRATRNARLAKAKDADSESETFRRQALEELIDCKQRLNTRSPQLDDLRSKSLEDQITAEVSVLPAAVSRNDNALSQILQKKKDEPVVKKGSRKKPPSAPKPASSSSAQTSNDAVLSTPIDVETSEVRGKNNFSNETHTANSSVVEVRTSNNEASPRGTDIEKVATSKNHHKKTKSNENTVVIVVSDNDEVTEAATVEPEISEMEIDSPAYQDSAAKESNLNEEVSASAIMVTCKPSPEPPIQASAIVPTKSSNSTSQLTSAQNIGTSSLTNIVDNEPEIEQKTAPEEKGKSIPEAPTKLGRGASKPPAIPRFRGSIDPPKTPDNDFKVNEDGKISAASIGKLQGFGATDSDKNEATQFVKVGAGSKSNKLFKPSLFASGKRPPFGGSSRKPMSAAASSSGAKLASITPGLRKPLDLSGLNKTTKEKASSASIDIATSLFPQPVVAVPDARKKISFAGLPEDPVSEKIQEAPVVEEVAAKKTIEKKSASEADRLFPKSIFAAPSPVPVAHKEASSHDRLFEKSIFAEPSPETIASKKSISFASHAKLTNDAGVQTEVSVGDASKKRAVSSIEGEPSSPAVLKRPRISGKSHTGKSMTAKSALRERIESLRKRPGYQSIGTPASIAPATPVAPANKFDTHLSPLRTPAVHTSTMGSAKAHPHKSFNSLQITPSLDDQASVASPSLELAHGLGDTPASMRRSPEELAEQTRSSRKSLKNVAASAETVPALELNVANGSENQNTVSNATEDDATTMGEDGDDPGVLSNLMTSVKSFMPATAAVFFGYKADDNDEEETEEERTARIAEENRIDAERREAEIIARRKAEQQQRHAEAEEKRRRAEEKRKALMKEKRRKDEEIKRKEAQRIKRLREELDARKKKKEEEDRKRELRHQRVREHQQKVAAAEAARRAELERKEAERRPGKYGRSKGAAGASGAGSSKMPMSAMKARSAGDAVRSTPGTQRTLFHERKKEEVTSYEMSAERPNAEDNSDDDSEDTNNRGKKIPDWARNGNVLKALEEQNDDPDKTFARVHSVNLEDVFASTQNMKKRYRTRNSSGQWTRDRLTAREEMEYKKRAGFI